MTVHPPFIFGFALGSDWPQCTGSADRQEGGAGQGKGAGKMEFLKISTACPENSGRRGIAML
jgi:hypothetical protein